MTSPVLNPESLGSAKTSKTYTSFVADINLITEKGETARRVRINTAGSGALSVSYPNGDTDTITGLLAGDVLEVQATKILSSGTSVGSVTVMW